MYRKSIKSDVGVIIGRFQVNQLHDGHIELLDWVNKEHQKVIVVLGVAVATGTRENPLDFESRYQMIRDMYPEFLILPLIDKKTDQEWSISLDNLINGCVTPSQSVILYGSRDSFIPKYSGNFNKQELVGDHNIWTGTKVRESVKQKALPTADFRAGVIWASYNAYPRVVATVDIAISDSKNRFFLLVRKPNEKEWRFPGGFADPKSLNYEDDAIREAKEETGAVVQIERYLDSINIQDWRYTGVDKIRTTFFLAQYESGDINANDDVCEVKWFKFSDMTSDLFVDTHKILFAILKKTR